MFLPDLFFSLNGKRNINVFSLISASGYKDALFSIGTAALRHTAVELQSVGLVADYS